MTIERLEELEASLARAYSISGDPELVDVNKHAECYGDIQKLVEREIERQSVTDDDIYEAIASEEVQEAIDTLRVIRPTEKEIQSGEYPEVAEAIDIAITALKAYQSTTRKNRAVEEVAISKCEIIGNIYDNPELIEREK